MIGGGLELQQQHQVGVAAIAPRDTPDHVAFPPFARLGMELGVLPLHEFQIEVIEPGPGDEVAQQLGHHGGVLKQTVVEVIVVAHAPCLPWPADVVVADGRRPVQDSIRLAAWVQPTR